VAFATIIARWRKTFHLKHTPFPKITCKLSRIYAKSIHYLKRADKVAPQNHGEVLKCQYGRIYPKLLAFIAESLMPSDSKPSSPFWLSLVAGYAWNSKTSESMGLSEVSRL